MPISTALESSRFLIRSVTLNVGTFVDDIDITASRPSSHKTGSGGTKASLELHEEFDLMFRSKISIVHAVEPRGQSMTASALLPNDKTALTISVVFFMSVKS
jgi:nucleotide-binding universal stress UspA family protein